MYRQLRKVYAAVRDLFSAEGMDSASHAAWSRCASLDDLGHAMAMWLRGEIQSQPGYCGPVDVDEDDAPGMTAAMIALCEAGIVTHGFQAGYVGSGYDGAHWQQLAAVEAFCDDVAAQALCAAAQRAGLYFITESHRGASVTWRDRRPVTRFGSTRPRRELADSWTGYGICRPAAVEAVANAWQVAIIDPRASRNDRLWPMLAKVAAELQAHTSTTASAS